MLRLTLCGTHAIQMAITFDVIWKEHGCAFDLPLLAITIQRWQIAKYLGDERYGTVQYTVCCDELQEFWEESNPPTTADLNYF